MMTNTQTVDNLKARVEVVEEICRSIGVDQKIVEDELADYLKDIGADVYNAQAAHTTEAQRSNQERYLAVILLSVVNHNRAEGHLLQELKNNALKGQSKFTGTLEEALSTINN